MAAYTRSYLMGYAEKMAVKYGIDPAIFLRQIQQESNFDPNAHNPSGATGIGQLMPQYYPNAGQDPLADLESAARTDAANLKHFGSNALMLAAYDAGAGAVEKAGGVPNFPETQRYVSTILGDQGGKTMDANQPTGGDDLSSLFDQAINGTPPSAAAQTPTPSSVTGDGETVLHLLEAAKGPVMRIETLNPTVKDTSGFGGTLPNQEPTYRYWWKDGTYVDGAALNTGLVIKGGTALKALSSTATAQKAIVSGANTSDKFIVTQDPTTGAITSVPNPNYVPGAPNTNPKTTVSGASASDRFILQTDPVTGGITAIPNPNYVGPDPVDAMYKQALTAEAQARTAETQASTQKIQQSLRPTAQAAIQDAYATIGAIQQQIASGKMSPTEGNALMQQVHQGLSATLAGTTLFEQQKQQQDMDTQRAQTASSYLSNRVSNAASLGSTLFNAASHVYLPAGKSSLGIDPLAIANQEVNQMGGGQQTGNAAAAFLASVFGKAGSSAVPPGGQGQPSFPTTRDAVLAQYPHLVQQQPPAPPPPQAAMAGS